ncbi:MAG: histidinol-phosphate transaminase [Bacteroidota bacterium]|nr:histidinol-phosphate transaminase [Bacteroidota bacterium]
MNYDLNSLLRENIKRLVPYSSARDEYKGKEGVFLDANENSFGSPLPAAFNRYPDPLQMILKQKIAESKDLDVSQIFLGNGSDEAIDILFRAFCKPGIDNVIICPPTYGMYEVSANINDVKVIKVPLQSENFQPDIPAILTAIDTNTKLIFFCCPNNPTGTSVKWADIKEVIMAFNGIVVIDEAYIDFAGYKSLIPELKKNPNMILLQTLSKAWGLAGLRIGMAFAAKEIIDVFNKIKPPYNINSSSQQLAVSALENAAEVNQWVEKIKTERDLLKNSLNELSFVLKVYPSEANFLLVKMSDARKVYDYLAENKFIVRDRSNVILCEGCLRITIGTVEQNKQLIFLLKNYKP